MQALTHAKMDTVSEDDRAAIEAMLDPHALTELVSALGQATDAPAARSALDAATGAPQRG